MYLSPSLSLATESSSPHAVSTTVKIAARSACLLAFISPTSPSQFSWKKSQYLASAEYPQIRRELNQGIFAKLFVDDDEIVGSNLTPAYQRLMTDDLATDLAHERKREETGRVRTSDLYIVPTVTAVTERAHMVQPRMSADLPGKAVRDAQKTRFDRFLRLERPRGALPWEIERTPVPEDRSSNELLLVAGAGFEPATSGRDRRA